MIVDLWITILFLCEKKSALSRQVSNFVTFFLFSQSLQHTRSKTTPFSLLFSPFCESPSLSFPICGEYPHTQGGRGGVGVGYTYIQGLFPPLLFWGKLGHHHPPTDDHPAGHKRESPQGFDEQDFTQKSTKNLGFSKIITCHDYILCGKAVKNTFGESLPSYISGGKLLPRCRLTLCRRGLWWLLLPSQISRITGKGEREKLKGPYISPLSHMCTEELEKERKGPSHKLWSSEKGKGK